MVQHVHGQGHIDAAVMQRELLRIGLDQGQPPRAAKIFQRAQHPRGQVQAEGVTAPVFGHQLAQVEPVAAADVGYHLGVVPRHR